MTTRRDFLKTTAAGLATAALTGVRAVADEAKRPNVLMIICDDLNDWCACYGGHPQAKTPNIDRLARRGIRFDCAHVQYPWCGPSRASMMTGLLPLSTGIYQNYPAQFSKYPGAADATTLPKCFQNGGYTTRGVGKIYHTPYAVNIRHEFDRYGSEDMGCGRFGPVSDKAINWKKRSKYLDWGAYPEHDEQMADHKMADWAVKELDTLKGKQDKPFFMTVGFYRPHCPHTVPQKWLDMYPLDSLKMPQIKWDDLDDVPDACRNSRYIKERSAQLKAVKESGKLPSLVQAYLACVSFVDHQVGRVLDALQANGQADDTIVVLLGDHGYHLGEKTVWMKRTLWEEATRAPLIATGPGVEREKVCNRSVGMVDLYPTLAELCSLPKPDKLDGASLVPLLQNPEREWDRPAITYLAEHTVSVRSERYRYTRYPDGGEEFYDEREDPHEWTNLAGDPRYSELMQTHRSAIPGDAGLHRGPRSKHGGQSNPQGALEVHPEIR